MARPRQYDAHLRERLLERASRVIAEHGAGALTLRALAAEAGTSTSAIYALFGSKHELYLAVVQEAIASFGAAQVAVPVTSVPLDDLKALAWTYWDWGVRHPHLYHVMFSVAMADPKAVAELRDVAQATREPLRRCVVAALTAGQIEGPEVGVVMSVWAAVHGVTSICVAQVLGRNAPAESLRPLAAATIHMLTHGWAPRA